MWLQLYNYKIYVKLIIEGLGYDGFCNKITNKRDVRQLRSPMHVGLNTKN